MKIQNGKFACEACGKRYAWKPQLAGKKAKCACGAMMIVPQQEAPAAGAEEDDLYGLAEDALPPATAVARPLPASAPVTQSAGVGAGVGAIGYRSALTKENTKQDRFSFDAMTHPPRDLYIPVALLILGLLGILAWAMSWGAGPGLVAVVSLITGAATLVKTAVMIGLAFVFAPMLGVSFGDARTAVLKFAAIIVFTDAVGLWFDELIELAGGRPSGRRGRGSIFWLEMFLIAGLISAMCYYLFDMDSEETGMFAIPFAVISRILDWILGIVMGAILLGVLSAAATPAATPAPAPAPGAPAAPGGVALQANAQDREIERMIGSGSRTLTEANEYNQSQPQKSKREPQLVSRFYAAGAKRVYFGLGGGTMIVQLPDDPASRAKCFAISDAYHRTTGARSAVPKEEGQRYVEVALKEQTR